MIGLGLANIGRLINIGIPAFARAFWNFGFEV
jgi:hypothetical protein